MRWFATKTLIPGPSGPHSVGTTRFEVSEPGYLEALSTGPRRVPVQAWYPAEKTDAPREPALGEAVRAALAEWTGVPKFLLRPGESFSVMDAPVVPGRYPVLLFNHGFASFQQQSASLLQELASHGYVALSIGHPFESLVVEYPDGTVVRARRDLPAWKAVEAGVKDLEQGMRVVGPLYERARAAKDADTLRQIMNEVSALPAWAPLLPVLEHWTRDTRLVLDNLGQAPARLQDIMDAGHVGAFGHSLGGILAGQLAMTEPRVRAGISYDGAQLPPATGKYALSAPFCFVYADTLKVGATTVRTEGINDALALEGPTGSCGVCLLGAGHLNFTDMNNRASMKRALGSIDRGELARALRALTVGFFDHHLKGKPLTGLTPTPVMRVHWPKG